jgi:uncharacterized protein (UPF0264 family)
MRMLVSVRDVAEAREALRAGVDFIDLKEPSAGALGGLALPVIREVVAALRAGAGAGVSMRPGAEGAGGRGAGGVIEPASASASGEVNVGARARGPMISATIGDLPPDALQLILDRAKAVGACGVDLVKVGVPGRGAAACVVLEALAALPLAIVPVLIADDGLDAAVIDAACAPAFAAVMADTQAKRAGSLLELLGADALAAFIDRAHAAGRLVGLAGALRLADLPALERLGADFAGFRSAVCDGSREGRLDPGRLEALHAAIAIRGQARSHGSGASGRLEALHAAVAIRGQARSHGSGATGRLEALHVAVAIRGQARSHGSGATGGLEALGEAVAMTPTAAPVQIRAADALAT